MVLMVCNWLLLISMWFYNRILLIAQPAQPDLALIIECLRVISVFVSIKTSIH